MFKLCLLLCCILINNQLFSMTWIYKESPYEILGINQSATKSEIRKAFHNLALKTHPDKVTEELLKKYAEENKDLKIEKNKENFNAEVKAAEEKFKKVRAAYEILENQLESTKYVPTSAKPHYEDIQKIIHAIINKDIDAFNELLAVSNIAEKIELNSFPTILKFFENTKININDFWSPFHFAAAFGTPEMIEKIVTSKHLKDWAGKEYSGKKLLDITTFFHLTPLQIAILFHQADNAEKLLTLDALPNHKPRKETALSLLIKVYDNFKDKKKFKQVLTTLLEKGGNINQETGERDKEVTPLTIALNSNNKELIALLDTLHAGLNHQDNNGLTPLIYAAANGYINVVNDLLKYKPNLDIQEDSGKTALHAAFAATLLKDTGDIEKIVKLLVSAGADLNKQDNSGKTPLIFAIEEESSYFEKKYSSAIQVLLEAGAKVNIADKSSKTALMIAAEKQYPQTVEMLLKSGANVDIRDRKGRTALDFASLDAITLLFEKHHNIQFLLEDLMLNLIALKYSLS